MGIGFVVKTIFQGRDEQSKRFNRMGRNAKKFGETSSRAFKKASKSATSFGTITKGILSAQVVTKSVSLLTQGLTEATTAFIGFDDSITAASAKFKGLDLSTKEGQKTLEELKKSARDTGATTKFSAEEAAGGLDFYATAGFNAAQAMAVLKPTAKLATIANLDLARTSDIASDSIGAFGLMTEDSAQLQKNFTRVSDVMAKTMTSTNTNMEDMFESIKKGAPTFTATGQSIETFNTLMGTMANAGVKGAESGTQLRNMMLQLSKPTKEAQEVLSTLGIETKDQSGNFRDVIDILADFETGLEGMGTANKAAALKTVFGTRSVTGLNLLLKAGTKNLRKFRTQLDESGGTTKKMADIMDKSLGNRLKSLQSAALEVGFQFLDSFKVKGVGALEFLTESIRGINVQPIINGIEFITDTAGMMIDKFNQIGESTGLFDTLKNTIIGLNPTFETLQDIVKTVWEFLGDSGILNFVIRQFNDLVEIVGLLGAVFDFWWSGFKPVLGFIAKALKPILDGFEKLGNFGDSFGGVGGITKFIRGLIPNNTPEVSTSTGVSNVLEDFLRLKSPNPGSSVFRINNQAPPASVRQPPNKTQVQSQVIRQERNSNVRLDIAGAPEGSKITGQKAADPVDIRLLGRPASLAFGS